MMAVGAAVGGALVLSDEERRRQLLDRAREVGGQFKEALGDQWRSESPRAEEWIEQGRRQLESGSKRVLPEE